MIKPINSVYMHRLLVILLEHSLVSIAEDVNIYLFHNYARMLHYIRIAIVVAVLTWVPFEGSVLQPMLLFWQILTAATPPPPPLPSTSNL